MNKSKQKCLVRTVNINTLESVSVFVKCAVLSDATLLSLASLTSRTLLTCATGQWSLLHSRPPSDCCVVCLYSFHTVAFIGSVNFIPQVWSTRCAALAAFSRTTFVPDVWLSYFHTQPLAFMCEKICIQYVVSCHNTICGTRPLCSQRKVHSLLSIRMDSRWEFWRAMLCFMLCFRGNKKYNIEQRRQVFRSWRSLKFLMVDI